MAYDQSLISPDELHPRIKAEFKAATARAQASTDAFEACMFIMERSSWGDRETRAMQAATAQDMEIIIRRLPGSQLRYFMLKMMELFLQKSMYEAHFGRARWIISSTLVEHRE